MTFRSAALIRRIGMIIPSSSTTMETEIPELLLRQSLKTGDRFTFHSARLRMRQVTLEAQSAMNELAIGAVGPLCDADVDALIYACLLSTPLGTASPRSVEARLVDATRRITAGGIRPLPAVISSAGALAAALQLLGAERIALGAPCRKEFTDEIAAALAGHGFKVVQTHSRDLVDNVDIGRLGTEELLGIVRELDLADAEAPVLSACTQMPSLDILDDVEQALGMPVIRAATASVHLLLERLGIERRIEGVGWLMRRPSCLTASTPRQRRRTRLRQGRLISPKTSAAMASTCCGVIFAKMPCQALELVV